jgi:hypothetical protein
MINGNPKPHPNFHHLDGRDRGALLASPALPFPPVEIGGAPAHIRGSLDHCRIG